MIALLALLTFFMGGILALADSTVSGLHLWAILFFASALFVLSTIWDFTPTSTGLRTHTRHRPE